MAAPKKKTPAKSSAKKTATAKKAPAKAPAKAGAKPKVQLKNLQPKKPKKPLILKAKAVSTPVSVVCVAPSAKTRS